MDSQKTPTLSSQLMECSDDIDTDSDAEAGDSWLLTQPCIPQFSNTPQSMIPSDTLTTSNPYHSIYLETNFDLFTINSPEEQGNTTLNLISPHVSFFQPSHFSTDASNPPPSLTLQEALQKTGHFIT